MLSTNKSGISHFINELLKHGVEYFVCSPGSRNAPIVISLDEHPKMKTFVIHDERSAAFYALGMAQELKKPVAVVCTSGSAVLNYFPAVAEAFYQNIPLIIISADRPREWINHGDGQTIMQENVFGKHVKSYLEIPELLADKTKIEADLMQSFMLCNGPSKGPIHFNCPLNEPLYNTAEVEGYSSERYSYETKKGEIDLNTILPTWKDSKKIMVLIGQMNDSKSLQGLLSKLSEDSRVAVLVENTSNCFDKKFIHCIDRTLNSIKEDEKLEFEPDLLITLGGAIISKRIKQFLRSVDQLTHWRVGIDFPEMDTYRQNIKSFEISPNSFIDVLLTTETTAINSTYGFKWRQLDLKIQDKVELIKNEIPYSDLKVIELLLDYLPESSNLHMSNSSVVRYCQLFDPIHSVTYYCNRGTSGIDGSTSTAAGVSVVSANKLNVLITGDVSFLYDSNALWSEYIKSNFRIVVINNNGGGIFRIINGPEKSNQLETYFEAKHNYSAEKICDAFNVEYHALRDVDNFDAGMRDFYSESVNGRPKLIEIFTHHLKNDKVLKGFFEELRS